MTCREFEEVVMDAARGAAAEPEHARSCGRCAVRLAAERRLTEALRAVAEEDEEFSAGLGAEARLREQFRRLHATPRRKAWRWAGVAGGAIAAGLAMLAVLREPPRPPVEKADRAGAVRPLSPEGPAAASSETALAEPPKTMLDDAGVQRALPTRGGTAQVDGSPLVTREVATQFLPLGAGLIDAGERAQVVRISVPKTALLALGLPVKMERLEERVQADVLLGEDGTARAIRFVSER
jgi:hypothetical protein